MDRPDETTQRTRLSPPTPPPGYRPPPPQRTGPGSGGYPVPAPAVDGPPWRKWLLTALAVAAAAVVGILVASLFTGNDDNSAAAALPPVTASAPSTTEDTPAPPGPLATAQERPTDAASTSTIAVPGFPAMRNALLAYYALLPKQPQTAWSLLSPTAQAQVPGGYPAYAQDWTTVATTHVDAVVPHGSSGVLARISLVGTDKKITTTNYQIDFADQNGQPLINSATQVGKTQTTAPSKPGKPHH